MRAHLDTSGLIEQPLEEGAAAADGQQGGHPEGEQLSIEMDGALKLRAGFRLGETFRGKREATDYARMSIDQSSSSVLRKLGEPDNRFAKMLHSWYDCPVVEEASQ